MDRKTKGRLAEAAVLKELVSLGYEPYTPFCDNGKYDFLAYKQGKIHRISVKFTSSRGKTSSRVTWSVSLKQVSRRANNLVQVDNFDWRDWDLLAVYVGPEDRVILIPVDENFKSTTQLYVS